MQFMLTGCVGSFHTRLGFAVATFPDGFFILDDKSYMHVILQKMYQCWGRAPVRVQWRTLAITFSITYGGGTLKIWFLIAMIGQYHIQDISVTPVPKHRFILVFTISCFWPLHKQLFSCDACDWERTPNAQLSTGEVRTQYGRKCDYLCMLQNIPNPGSVLRGLILNRWTQAVGRPRCRSLRRERQWGTDISTRAVLRIKAELDRYEAHKVSLQSSLPSTLAKHESSIYSVCGFLYQWSSCVFNSMKS